MHPARLLAPLTAFLPWLLLLASCSSPPRPPSVDNAPKRPANTAMAVELQACSSELRNSQLRALGAERSAARAAIEQQRLALLRDLVAKLEPPHPPKLPQPQPQPQPDSPEARPNAEASAANAVAIVHFEYGSTRVDIPASTASALLKEAKGAPLILLRGRTDGQGDVAAESRIARARAAAVADYLVAAGVSPSQIRATYQPTGDHLADNQSAQGRRLNRRVEIEIYRALPVALNTASASSALSH
ncbi:OmpA family protein [Paucibacter sp. PLA-PC-4]|uniref:OmpA family protein n=1 Tax=Paucibacter sp. PLA-PC-4 TaxID=2993655 RepID=UPI00224ADF31|nr:OmpA family protein [Paucibacter sp. PLA-PC-4]MCX2865359.1 OmpA family protein [Paucibacter sp. PLA-PC-4]